MHESKADIRRLQEWLDSSYARAGAHLRSIVRPERRLSAEQVCAKLQGMSLLNLATVNSRCEPIVAPIDGIFFRGLFWFGSAANSLRFKHIRARPQVSATHTRGEELLVVVHGVAREIDTASGNYEDFRRCLREVYGRQFEDGRFWETAPYAFIGPRVIYAASFRASSSG